jgi:hypothetical protein
MEELSDFNRYFEICKGANNNEDLPTDIMFMIGLCATNAKGMKCQGHHKVAGSISDEVVGFFN